MYKRIIILILILAVVLSLATIEKVVINNTFDNLEYRLIEISNDIHNEEVHMSDIESLIKYWNKQKKILQMVVPHIEIRSVEIYLYQLKNAIEYNKYFEGGEYVKVLISQAESVPKTFVLCLENIL